MLPENQNMSNDDLSQMDINFENIVNPNVHNPNVIDHALNNQPLRRGNRQRRRPVRFNDYV